MEIIENGAGSRVPAAAAFIATDKDRSESGLQRLELRTFGSQRTNVFLDDRARRDNRACAVAFAIEEVHRDERVEEIRDAAWVKAEFAAELSRRTGRTIPYRNLPEADYAAVLLQAGLPPPLARGPCRPRPAVWRLATIQCPSATGSPAAKPATHSNQARLAGFWLKSWRISGRKYPPKAYRFLLRVRRNLTSQIQARPHL